MKILVVFGTRPEALKMIPIIRELKNRGDQIVSRVCVTAQHRDMLDQVLNLFSIDPDYDLSIMKRDQDLFEMTSTILDRIRSVLKDENPDLLLVQGDTTTAFVSTLAAYYMKIPIGHVEAGLRTADKYRPFPEELNRRMVSVLADLHFAPTKRARERLIHENIPEEQVTVTGNPIVDMLNLTLDLLKSDEVILDVLRGFDPGKRRLILVTGHRRESFGEGLHNICLALKELVSRREDVEIVYPVHLNPNVLGPVRKVVGNIPRIHLIEPLDYLRFVRLMHQSDIILTDSGGIQEEAPTLGKPVLVMRSETERIEGIEAGTARLVGTQKDAIIRETERLLDNKEAYAKMSCATNPYGDGKASQRIVDVILQKFRGK